MLSRKTRQCSRTICSAIDRGSTKLPPKSANSFVINNLINIKGDVRVSVAMPGDVPDIMLGVIDISEARARAELEGTDLVLLNAHSDPPVLKIVDIGKLRYQMDLKKKANLKKSSSKDIKEVKLSYNIGVGDYEVRLSKTADFLKKGHRVKINCLFRGREQQHGTPFGSSIIYHHLCSRCVVWFLPSVKIGAALLEKLAADLCSLASADPSIREGNRLSILLRPREQ
jgi:translation initiation factor IF-3